MKNLFFAMLAIIAIVLVPQDSAAQCVGCENVGANQLCIGDGVFNCSLVVDDCDGEPGGDACSFCQLSFCEPTQAMNIEALPTVTVVGTYAVADRPTVRIGETVVQLGCDPFVIGHTTAAHEKEGANRTSQAFGPTTVEVRDRLALTL